MSPTSPHPVALAAPPPLQELTKAALGSPQERVFMTYLSDPVTALTVRGSWD